MELFSGATTYVNGRQGRLFVRHRRKKRGAEYGSTTEKIRAKRLSAEHRSRDLTRTLDLPLYVHGLLPVVSGGDRGVQYVTYKGKQVVNVAFLSPQESISLFTMNRTKTEHSWHFLV